MDADGARVVTRYTSKLQHSNRRAASVDSEFCALNETGAIGRRENDGFSDLIHRSRAVAPGPGRRVVPAPFPLPLHLLFAWVQGSHCIDADTVRAIFGRPVFRQQIDSSLARAVETKIRSAPGPAQVCESGQLVGEYSYCALARGTSISVSLRTT
jgi:hypothetical protein